MDLEYGPFVWSAEKERANAFKHGVDFVIAAKAFRDERRVIVRDAAHSDSETRMFCLGKVDGRVLTVRFVYRGGRIRIIGAGYWRKGERFYAKEARS